MGPAVGDHKPVAGIWTAGNFDWTFWGISGIFSHRRESPRVRRTRENSASPLGHTDDVAE